MKKKKAACVNILPGVESHYRWQGKKETAREILLIVKTQEKLLDELISLVKRQHPYSVQEIVVMPIIGGNEDYLKWLEMETN